MDYRFAEAEVMEQVETLWDYCFEKREEPFFQYYFSQYNGKENKVYGAFQKTDKGDKLLSMVHLNPYSVRINGQLVDIPYLVGVATAEEARGHHLMGQMLQRLFAEPELVKLPFVFLMPINAGIYLPYDFAFTHYRHEYKVPSEALGDLAESSGTVTRHKALQLGDKGLLALLYEKYTQSYNGVNSRPDKQWDKLLTVGIQEEMQLAVAQKNSQPMGYMLYHLVENKLEIFELAAQNADARNSLLRYAAEVGKATDAIHWLAPCGDKTYLYFRDQSHSGRVAPFMMFRVVNLMAAVKIALDKSGNISTGKIILQLTDRLIPENNGSFLLNAGISKEDGRASSEINVKKLAEAAYDKNQSQKIPEMKLSIGTLTQILMGTFTAQELYAAGKIQCSDQEAVAFLDSWFPQHNNWINEYF